MIKKLQSAFKEDQILSYYAILNSPNLTSHRMNMSLYSKTRQHYLLKSQKNISANWPEKETKRRTKKYVKSSLETTNFLLIRIVESNKVLCTERKISFVLLILLLLGIFQNESITLSEQSSFILFREGCFVSIPRANKVVGSRFPSSSLVHPPRIRIASFRLVLTEME